MTIKPNFTWFANEALKQIKEQEEYLKQVIKAAKKVEEATKEYKNLVELWLWNENNYTTPEIDSNNNDDNEDHNVLDWEETYSGEENNNEKNENYTEENLESENENNKEDNNEENNEGNNNEEDEENNNEEDNEINENDEEIPQWPKINLSILKNKDNEE